MSPLLTISPLTRLKFSRVIVKRSIFCLSVRSVRERTFPISCSSWVSLFASGLVRSEV